MDVVDQPGSRLLAQGVDEAAALLRLLSSERRLLVMCHLMAHGEMSVSQLAVAVGLSQPALSQHLAQLRGHGLVATRREAQTIHYRVADARAERVVSVLHELFCPTL